MKWIFSNVFVFNVIIFFNEVLFTVALDIFFKVKNNTLYLPWISPLSFFCAKGVNSVKLSGEVPY